MERNVLLIIAIALAVPCAAGQTNKVPKYPTRHSFNVQQVVVQPRKSGYQLLPLWSTETVKSKDLFKRTDKQAPRVSQPFASAKLLPFDPSQYRQASQLIGRR